MSSDAIPVWVQDLMHDFRVLIFQQQAIGLSPEHQLDLDRTESLLDAWEHWDTGGGITLLKLRMLNRGLSQVIERISDYVA